MGSLLFNIQLLFSYEHPVMEVVYFRFLHWLLSKQYQGYLVLELTAAPAAAVASRAGLVAGDREAQTRFLGREVLGTPTIHVAISSSLQSGIIASWP